MNIIDFILHIDKHLENIINTYGNWAYGVLFLIVFAETGLIVTPLLPGDSLLFAVGALCGRGLMDIYTIIPLLFCAAIIGDNVNYFVGRYLGEKVYTGNYKLIKKDYIVRTQGFYEKHGGKAIVFARFIPIIRTFAPFVAGVGKMNYTKFLAYSISGGIFWVVSFTLLGYKFGGLDIVKKNFTLVVFGIIGISLLPAVYQFVKIKMQK
jgi:membrane-associated protein